jgi:TetR/AcrR family transcriptional regulator
MTVAFQRARKPEEKAVRREAILGAAAELVEQERIENVSLNAIAELAGVSKPNVYRYFESREHILLALFIEDAKGFTADAEAGLGGSTKTLNSISAALAQAYARRSRLCRLLGVLSSILEQNVSTGVIAECKAETLVLAGRLAKALHERLPAVPVERCAWALGTIALYAAALWPVAHPAAAAAEVLRKPQFGPLARHFEEDLKAMAATLLMGLNSQFGQTRKTSSSLAKCKRS